MSSASWNFFPLSAVFTLGKRECNQEKWDCLDKSEWSLGMIRVSIVSSRLWVSVGISSSLNLHGGFDE
jgi:hypothetical protein